ncbi:MAG: acyl-CoA thioesterase [Bdellovibrionota bacterium]
MTNSKTRASSLVSTQKIVAGEHLNPNGVLFGGYLMCWVDEIAFLCARRFTGEPGCVTVNIDNITFKTPIKLGEHILLSAWVNHVGTTSMEIEVSVQKENPKNHQLVQTNSAHLTFVCLNKKLKPIPVPRITLDTIEDHIKNQEAQIRAKVRKRLTGFLRKKLNEDWSSPRPRKGALDREFSSMVMRRLKQQQPRSLLKDWVKSKISYLDPIGEFLDRN